MTSQPCSFGINNPIMKKIVLTTLIILAGLVAMQAQKFGHVNSSQLILALPEVKTADAALEAYQKQLFVKGEEMVKAFEKEYTAYMGKANSGELSQLQMQQQEAALTGQQQKIQQYEVEVQNKLAAKKQELYQPILNKVQEVVEKLGKEMGYTMIFDTSMGGLLFVEDAEDLMPALKTKLGIQ